MRLAIFCGLVMAADIISSYPISDGQEIFVLILSMILAGMDTIYLIKRLQE